MAQQINHCFIVTSAINSKFGVFSPLQRLDQTLATIDSIKARIPDAKIVVMECCGEPIQVTQAAALKAYSDVFIDYSTDPDVQALYDNDNWDVVKNTTEIMCFGRALEYCQDHHVFENTDRIHKMSGRYLLNADFDPALYEQHADQILIGPKYASQFPFAVTGIERQYMARLWSWPTSMTPDIITVYDDSFMYIAERVAAGGYADIEHVLYKFLPTAHVTEVPLLGVEGSIAPNGQPIKN